MPSTSAAACSPPTLWGSSQHRRRAPRSRARSWTDAAAIRRRSGVSASRSPRPTTMRRLPAACVTARWRKDGRASPLSTRACIAPSMSCGMHLPSKRPTATVSQSVSAGSASVAVASMPSRLVPRTRATPRRLRPWLQQRSSTSTARSWRARPALHWARAAHRSGLLPRRQLWADGWANVMFRLQGSTDEAHREGARPRRRLDRGPQGRRSRPSGPARALRRPAAAVPADARGRLPPPGRRRPGLHLHRGDAGHRGHARPRPRVRRRGRLPAGGARRRLHGRLRRPVLLPGGQAGPHARARRAPAGWTSSRPGRTRTPSRTCRCSARSGTRWR